jgi:hypothetical protein
MTDIIENIVIYRGFTVIERGKDEKITSGDFKLDNHIYKNPQVRGTLVNSTIRSLKNWLKKTLNK